MSVRPDVVCWYEGMQLLPQHFQLQGLRAEAIAAHLARAANPWYWGVTQLSWEQPALVAGKLRILGLEATLPDGMPISIEPGEGGLPEFDLVEVIAAAPDASVTLYLAVSPIWQGQRLRPLDGRWRSALSEPVPNLDNNLDDEPVQVWIPHPRLVTDASKADTVCLPLLRISKADGGYKVMDDFIAPTPRILPESPLGQRVFQLCAMIREKCVFLGKRLQALQGDAASAEELRRQSAALWARLPEVEGLLNSRIATPQGLHGLLLGMAGSWSVLDPARGVPAFAPLDFLDLYRGYDEVLRWMEQVLGKLRLGYRSHLFKQMGNVYEISLPSSAASQTLVIGLRMPAGTPEEGARLWLGRTIIASAAQVPELARQRRPGLAHNPMSRKDQVAYGVGDDTRLFVIEAGGPGFDPHQPLQIVSTGSGEAFRPWQIVLLIDDDHEEQDA
ncbi:type VI secretion system baseplate subunit TssK [Pseudomonas putida CSV86]|uniref:Type VI secretion protein n=2 Tax=Pseudomonas TaxID=286 RepID=A0A177SDJ5_PSEPU|nr:MULTISPECIES: type VI secretion system baseplate subunit TssK [Pseudomonas]MDG9883460.1 type VI secretion system baseplate subunit TssK [Pseudomonas sp. GD04058]NNJ15354.1 type VI secretion system baseplate subunit TssK [Pseudomonas bharatica CSV86]OAI86440.1 type VI secretion protein [Pseudomonas putida]